MADARCDLKHHGEQPDLLTRINDLFNAFWGKLALREQQTKRHKQEEHLPKTQPTQSLHGRAHPRTQRAQPWRRRRQRPTWAYKLTGRNPMLAKFQHKENPNPPKSREPQQIQRSAATSAPVYRASPDLDGAKNLLRSPAWVSGPPE
ncbi:Hypothetical predicted protein [Pelobates cultripes]|uniref:Uncharacterized protein n=1 Tax=Pelobates cultripes TaxID=61616 RepID=A0AAD1TI16_PELCU|nr:Hypothetical predicted protein [Pelobates cultripes]